MSTDTTDNLMPYDFSVTRDTVDRDMAILIELKLTQKAGKARATHDVYAQSESSGIDR